MFSIPLVGGSFWITLGLAATIIFGISFSVCLAFEGRKYEERQNSFSGFLMYVAAAMPLYMCLLVLNHLQITLQKYPVFLTVIIVLGILRGWATDRLLRVITSWLDRHYPLSALFGFEKPPQDEEA